MTDHSLSRTELTRLLAKLVDDSLTDEEFERLDSTMRVDVAARRIYMHYLDMHEELAELSVPRPINIANDSRGPLGPLARDATGNPTSTDYFRPMTFGFPAAAGFFVVAMLLCMTIAWIIAKTPFSSLAENSAGFTSQHESIRRHAPGSSSTLHSGANSTKTARLDAEPVSRPPAPIATLTSEQNAVWDGDFLEIGQTLYVGDTIHLIQGQAGISVGYGAEIAAHAPCQLSFLAADQVRLSEGNIDVDVAKWARGFTVFTNEMAVVDLGTTFTVSSSGANAETTVIKGMVRAIPVKTRGGEQRSLLLSKGDRLMIDNMGNRKTFQHVIFDKSHEFDFGGLAPYRPVELHNTGRGLAVGDQDANWRITNGPDGDFVEPEYAQVCLPNERYLANDPHDSQWVSLSSWEEAAPNSVYTFQTTFNLEGYDHSTVRLFGRFLADNGVSAVRINGHEAQVESWVDNVARQEFVGPQFRFINVTEGMIEGANTVEVDVFNGTRVRLGRHMNVPNPMALRVEWYAFGRQTGPSDK